MVEVGCDCPEGMGVWHVHRTCTVIRSTLGDGQSFIFHSPWVDQPGWEVTVQFHYVKVMVDWKQVAHDLMILEAV